MTSKLKQSSMTQKKSFRNHLNKYETFYEPNDRS